MDRKGPYHNAEEDVFLTCHVFIKLMYRGLSQNYDISGEIDDDDHENSPEYTDSDEESDSEDDSDDDSDDEDSDDDLYRRTSVGTPSRKAKIASNPMSDLRLDPNPA